jgi:hypothetical protein
MAIPVNLPRQPIAEPFLLQKPPLYRSSASSYDSYHAMRRYLDVILQRELLAVQKDACKLADRCIYQHYDNPEEAARNILNHASSLHRIFKAALVGG